MGEEVVSKAFSLSDSVYLVLLVAVAIGFWRLILYVLRKNDEREKRYIDVIEALSNVEDIRKDVEEIKTYIYRKENVK